MSPTSVTSPICVWMFSVPRPKNSAASAPQAARGGVAVVLDERGVEVEDLVVIVEEDLDLRRLDAPVRERRVEAELGLGMAERSVGAVDRVELGREDEAGARAKGLDLLG